MGTRAPYLYAVGLMINTDGVSELVCSCREPPFQKELSSQLLTSALELEMVTIPERKNRIDRSDLN
jgi:hypothetical protein